MSVEIKHIQIITIMSVEIRHIQIITIISVQIKHNQIIPTQMIRQAYAVSVSRKDCQATDNETF